MAILITGGAGYIGSVTTELLRAEGEKVIVLDNLSRGHRAAVDPSVPFYRGNVGDRELIATIAAEHDLEACLHFAAFAYVGESVQHPRRYFRNNVEQGVGLLEGLLKAGVRKFVFSSTCATYGEPQTIPMDESHPQLPANPYGWSKFFMERILESYDQAYGLKFISLRYFNASGAIPERGEHHDPETHILPLTLAVALGKRESISVFGSDYPTPDGSAVRDYIHVADLAGAHIDAMRLLRRSQRSDVFNLGNGQGYSVLEVVEAARGVTGHPIPAVMAARRPGDPSHLVADASKAQRELGWKIKYPDLETIIETAWAWHRSHPDGYPQA
jgi:UDP-glucose 4-epimerase